VKEFAASLETATPREGVDLAARLAWEMVRKVQPSKSIRDRLVVIYEDDAEAILMACQIIAMNFQAIAAANNYWHDRPLA